MCENIPQSSIDALEGSQRSTDTKKIKKIRPKIFRDWRRLLPFKKEGVARGGVLVGVVVFNDNVQSCADSFKDFGSF
jgi:hypothetical protein